MQQSRTQISQSILVRLFTSPFQGHFEFCLKPYQIFIKLPWFKPVQILRNIFQKPFHSFFQNHNPFQIIIHNCRSATDRTPRPVPSFCSEFVPVSVRNRSLYPRRPTDIRDQSRTGLEEAPDLGIWDRLKTVIFQ